MVDFQENCHLFFKGSDESCAMLEVDLFGKATIEYIKGGGGAGEKCLL